MSLFMMHGHWACRQGLAWPGCSCFICSCRNMYLLGSNGTLSDIDAFFKGTIGSATQVTAAYKLNQADFFFESPDKLDALFSTAMNRWTKK